MRRPLATAAVALLVAATPLHAQLFDFDGADSPTGTATPFSLTRGGVTATFVATPGAMTVFHPAAFATLTGNQLADADPTANTLEVTFSAPQTFISLLFALNDPTNTAILTMNVFDGGTLVGSPSSSGAIPAGFGFPEGSLTYSGAPFDHVFIFASGAPDYAIDDVRLSPAAPVPEPATVGLLAGGLVVLGGAAARRRREA
jgi:hypothetical protein